MKKTNKILVIVVLVLVLIFGIGQFFASNLSSIGSSSNSTSTASTQTAVQTPTPTQIIHYVPSQPTSSTLVESGSCWTNSIAAPFRADAWRCAVGNGINDPCFQLPNSTSTLLCGINPTVANSTSTFVLKLTQALPKPEVPPAGTEPADWAWLVQLGDGTLCSPFTGTLPAITNDQSADYDCAPGPLGKNILIFNNFNTSSSQWTAEVGTLSQSTSGFQNIATSSTVPIETIWQ